MIIFRWALYLFKINELQKTYVSFFMDEFTPEWIFKSKIIIGSHNLDII